MTADPAAGMTYAGVFQEHHKKMTPGKAGYPSTYYAATRGDADEWRPLEGEHEVETCVVGGGLAGVATALALAERGQSVALLEGRRIGWGASGRNGGFASRGYPLAMSEIAAAHGADTAAALWRLGNDAMTVLRGRAEGLGPSVLTGHGALRCRMDGHPDTLAAYVSAMNDQFDAGLVHLPREALREMVATECYADGYLNPTSLQLHPLNLVRGMAGMATRRGAVLHEASPVTAIERHGARRRVMTAAGSVLARHVVLAGGAHLGLLHPRLGMATVPIASFVMTTAPAPERLANVIRTGYAVSDTRVATDYYRLLPDGRLLWGGRASARQYEPAKLAALLGRDMARIFPALAGLEVETAWSGLMPIARHRMPVIGPLAPGLWAASCFGGLGLVTTTLAGELIAGAIAEGNDSYRHFAPFGLPFAGGSAGRAAFQAIYWRHQMADRLISRRVARRRKAMHG